MVTTWWRQQEIDVRHIGTLISDLVARIYEKQTQLHHEVLRLTGLDRRKPGP